MNTISPAWLKGIHSQVFLNKTAWCVKADPELLGSKTGFLC
jgi:hypothetical protein